MRRSRRLTSKIVNYLWSTFDSLPLEERVSCIKSYLKAWIEEGLIQPLETGSIDELGPEELGAEVMRAQEELNDDSSKHKRAEALMIEALIYHIKHSKSAHE